LSQFIVLLALVFSIVIAIFAVQNTQPVQVQFLSLQVQGVAVAVLVLVSAALGALAMLMLGVAREVGLRWRHRAVTQQLRASQARVAELEASQPKLPTAPPPAAADGAPAPTTPTRTD
jgi:lipopolysaccharide assembly protein A